MNIAIVGSSGYIAGFLIDRFQQNEKVEQIIKIDQKSDADVILDLASPRNFNYTVLDNVDYVIFTAAVSSPDQCAENFDYCWNINVEGTGYFIAEAIKRNCRVLFFSSDAVFGDIIGCIYNEKTETAAETPYGRMKKAVEDRFKESKMFKAIRLSYVVSAKDRFVKYCLNCIENNLAADVFHPFYRNCISVTDVVDVVEWLLRHWHEFDSFVLNVAGKELVSRVRIADEINRLFGDRLRYTISTPNSEFYRNRPRITQMESLYLEKYHIIENNTFTEKIKKEVEELIK